jgi:hypothetical protein
MSRILSATLLLVSGLGICRANLGETEAQCIARYGSESDVQTDLGYRQVGDKAASFTLKNAKGSFNVRVTFLNGLSCHEVFTNADPSLGLTEAQMKSVLDSQSAGFKWEKGRSIYHTAGGETYGTIEWQRGDGAVARFYISGKASSESPNGQVDLSTKQYAVAQRFYDKENGD